MSPRKGRHPRRSKGPGGPRRTSRAGPAEVIPITRAPGARHREGLLGPSVDSLVRALLSSVRTLAAADDPARPLAVEVWADRMAATVYGPEQMPSEFYSDLAEGLLATDDADGPAALAALAHVLDHRDAAPLRRAHAAHRADLPADDRSDLGIGRARPVGAIEVSHPQGDGTTLVVDLDQPGSPHTVGVSIDHNLGGLARDLLVGPPDGARQAAVDAGAGLTVRAVPLDEVRARFEAAVALTDHTIDPPVAHDFEDVRAVVERRMALLPSGGRAPVPEVLEPEEIEALVEVFLASPEAGPLDDEERDQAASLLDPWLSHATGHATGDPHRISPTLIELFCVDWYPRHVIGDAATAAAAPAVLRAWTHHAARTTDLDDRWRDEALAAVDAFASGLVSAGPDLGLGGGRHDELDAELVDLVRSGEPDDGGSPLLAPVTRGPDDTTSWRPLQPRSSGPRRAAWEGRPDGLPPERETKVRAICLQSAEAADGVLGGAFVQPAVDLALRIGGLEPSPLPHTRDATWTSAIVWLLAEDSGALDPPGPGRTPGELDEVLPASRATTRARVTEIRDRLGLAPGDLAVAW